MNTPLHGSTDNCASRNTLPSLVRVLRDHAGRLARTTRLALHNPTRRRLLKALALNPAGLTYRELFRYLPDMTERWVRELVADLRRDGIVETPGNPAIVVFASEDVSAAVREVLRFLESDWIEAAASTGERMIERQGENSDVLGGLESYLETMTKMLKHGGVGS